MVTFESVKTDLIQISREFSSLFDKAKSISGISSFPFENWEESCRTIDEQINENILRVAVVGAIKSGKSTFVNAVLEGDFLKRGAGVVTSIVTRIRKGPSLNAKLIFKTWEEVNSEIEQAIVLFPSIDMSSGDGKFDIRRQKDRIKLSNALNSLSTEQVIYQDTRDVNVVLLSSYVKGYDRVADIISWDEIKTLQFRDQDFPSHKDYVGDDSLAVYLRDLELQIPARQNLDDNIEIADCQGSDSPNPLHLAMIQDYLLKTHLIVYLISSRTGVRQADIKFLSMIKKMGLLENIFFVVNCDFSEHEGHDDLMMLVDRIHEDISVIKPDPEIFTFSTLFDLFRKLRKEMSEKDKLRLQHWESETVLKEFSEGERKRFEKNFNDKLTRDRFALLLKNHVERLSVMVNSIQDWVSLNTEILSKNADDANDIIDKIKSEQEQMAQVRAMIKDTLDGASQKTKRELERDINSFLDVPFGDMFKEIQGFVRGYTINTRNNEDDLEAIGFSTTLYTIFQEFKHGLDVFMTEGVNPRLIQFIRQDEGKINNLLTTVAGTFDGMVQDTFRRYESTLQNLGIQLAGQSSEGGISFNVETLKRRAGLSVPPLVSSLQYTAKIRTEAIMRLGFYKFVKVMKKLFKRPIQNEKEGEIFALHDGVKRIKRETERSIIFHLGDYRENLKYQYIFKLVDVASSNLYDTLLDRFQIFTTDISDMMELVGKEHDVKEEAIQALTSLNASMKTISNNISSIKNKINF